MSGRSIHVFAPDTLPFPGCARTAGGNRSMQVISALRAAGHRVTFSFDFGTHMASTWAEKINRYLTDEDRWLCRHHSTPEIVLNRLQPEIAIHCNVNTFKTIRRFARDIIHIVDLNGPVHFEELMMLNPSKGGGIDIDGNRIELQCRQLVEKLRQIDYVLTVSERQKYFWLAYCSLAGFNFSELNAPICPFCFEAAPAERKPADKLTIVHAGSFYPWQDPERFLRAAAQFLDEIPGAKLHVAGGPHPGMPNERQAEAFLKELKTHRSVQLHGFLPIEKLTALLSTAWAALDLMEQSVERELAINGRTLQFLAAGIPVIYNDYSTLSADIREHRAGWTIPTKGPAALKPVFEELVAGGLPLVRELSANALRLSERFDPIRAMAPLVELCNTARKRPSMAASRRRRTSDRTAPVGRVLAISPQAGVLTELRMNNPLGALHRQRLIDGFEAADAACESLAKDNSFYEAIVIQPVRESVYLALANLGLPYLLDVDDNPLARARYREEERETGPSAGLRLASVLTAPTPRLVGLLEKYSGFSLANSAFITPNALPVGSATTVTPTQPSQLVWMQSDIAGLGNSRDTVARAVEDFSKKYGLPVVLVGKNVLDRRRFTNQVVMGEIDLSSSLQLLASAPTSIGVAPLETEADPETLDFIGAKSDLKIVLFGWYGHPGVFSSSPPYTDSPLRECGRITNNSYREWMEALEYQYREGWKSAAGHARRIQEERNVDRVARESWAPAIQACVLPRPVRGADLYEVFTSFNLMNSDPARALGYLAANPDVGRDFVTAEQGAWEHYQRHGKRENRAIVHDADVHCRLLAELNRESEDLFRRAEFSLRHMAEKRTAARVSGMLRTIEQLRAEVDELRGSYSWKITAPLRLLTKPILSRIARFK